MEKIDKHFRVLLNIYIVILIWAIFLKMNSIESIEDSFYYTIKHHHPLNWKNPFSNNKFSAYYFSWNTSAGRTNILNILAFIPYGFLVAAVSKNYAFLRATIWSFFLSLVFETLQFFTAIGGFEAMDLVLNTLGGVIGVVIFAIFNCIRKQINTESQENFTAAIATICYIYFVPLALYGIAKTAYHFDFYLSLIEPMINSWK